MVISCALPLLVFRRGLLPSWPGFLRGGSRSSGGGFRGPAEDGVAQGVEDLIAFFAIDENLFRAENGEVLGSVGLFEAEFGDQLTRRFLAGAEGFDDGNAGGMGEGLEDIGFELTERVGQVLVYSKIRIDGTVLVWLEHSRRSGGRLLGQG